MLLWAMILICDQNLQAKWKEAVVSTKMLGFLSFVRLEGEKMERMRERRGRAEWWSMVSFFCLNQSQNCS